MLREVSHHDRTDTNRTADSEEDQCLLVSELSDLDSLEELRRGTVKDRLQDATRSCSAPYGKGPNSFQLLGRLDPTVLEERLPSFRRARRILTDKLG